MKLYVDDEGEEAEIESFFSNRRKFIILSTSLIGSIPLNANSKSFKKYTSTIVINSFWDWYVESFGSFGSRKLVRLAKERNKLAISINENSLASNRKRDNLSGLVKERITYETGIPIHHTGIKYVIDRLTVNNKEFEVWDQEGLAFSRRDSSVYGNNIRVEISNESNEYTERKIWLMIISQGRKEYTKRLTVKAGAFQKEVFNISNAFVKLPSTGMKEIVYRVSGGHKDIKIKATNDLVLVSRMTND